MTMRAAALLAFAILAVSISTYGITSSASADQHLPLTVETDQTTYTDGNTITITGKIRSFNSNSTLNPAITIQVFSPAPSTVLTAADLILPADITDDGEFQTEIKATGPKWKASGDYVVKAFFQTSIAEFTFSYVGPDPVVVPPPDPICDDGQILVNGECVADVIDAPPPPPPPPPPVCRDGETLVDGECVMDIVEPQPQPSCGPGTVLDPASGTCIVDTSAPPPAGPGCLIATATYGTEMAPQVQMLRELRDNTVLSTGSGESFMAGFNDLYYSFSPYVADLERKNPAFKEAVRAFITPMISSLAIMSLAEPGSESQVLGLGIAVIALNLGMYVAAPALITFTVGKRIRARV